MKRFLAALILIGMIFSMTAGYTQSGDAEKHRYEHMTPIGVEGLLGACKDGKYGIVDAKGKVVSPCEWDSIGDEDFVYFSEGLLCVQKEGKYGFIDASGQVVIACEWDDAYAFDGGLARVKKMAHGAASMPREK